MAAGAASPLLSSLPTSPSTTTTAIVFAKLDPILQRLLEGLTSLKELIPSLSIQANGSETREATFVRLVQSLANDLGYLSRGLRLELDSSKPEQQQQQRLHHAKALCLLVRYITLPLTAVFHLPLRETYAPPSPPTEQGNTNGKSSANEKSKPPQEHQAREELQWEQTQNIRRSYVFRLYRLAAMAIRAFVEETTIPTAVEEARRTSSTNNILPTNTWIEYLVALIQSMPTYTEISKPTDSNAPPSSSLDDGSETYVAILEAAQSLVSCFATKQGLSGNEKDSTTVLLVEAWHGTLSMRLVDCLTAFLGTAGNRRVENFSSRVHRAATETLVVLLRVTKDAAANNGSGNGSSETLKTFWRSVFPGVFAALYQRIAIDTRSGRRRSEASRTTTPIKIEIQQNSLESLILLFRVTLVSGDGSPSKSVVSTRDAKTDFDVNQQKVSDLLTASDSIPPTANNNSNQDLLSRLNSMVLAANTGNNNSTSKDKIVKKDENVEKEGLSPPNRDNKNGELGKSARKEQSFLDQVRKRVQGPLVFLLRQLSLSSSDDIRREVVILCRVILLETRYCWVSKNDVDSLDTIHKATEAHPTSSRVVMERTAFEICVGFQQDPDALVRSTVREIIETYIDIDNCHSDSPSSSPSSLSSASIWMVPRIIELIQRLSALVHRGSSNMSNIKNGMSPTRSSMTTTTELRNELNLLAGYLQCLDSSAATFSSSDSEKGKKETAEKETRAIKSSMCNAIVSSKHLRRGLIQLFDVDLDSLSVQNGNLVSLVIDHNTNSPIKLRYLNHSDLISLARDTILRSLGKLLGPKYGAIFVDEVLSDFIEASFQMPKTNSKHSSNEQFESWLHEWIGSLIVAEGILLGSFSFTDINTENTDTDREQHKRGQSLPLGKKEKRKMRILLSLASSILPLVIDSSLWNLSIDSRTFTLNTTPNSTDANLSPQTLQRNQIVVVLLMELIGTISQLLGRNLREVLISVLYPIVEKTAHRGSQKISDIVQYAGLSTLKIMSVSCGLQSVEDMIHAEQNQLLAVLVGRLRLPGGSRVPRSRNDAEGILSVAETSIWALEMINRRSSNNSQQNDDELNGKNNSEGSKNPAIVDLVSLLDYRLDHLFLQKVLLDVDIETICFLHKAFFNYFLITFQVKREKTYSYKMKNLEKDSQQPWLDLLSQFRKIPPLDPPEMNDGDMANESKGRLLDVTKGDIKLFSKLIARDCYLLSYQKLKSRISSCDALTMAFKFLAFVGSVYDDPTDDRNVIRNTILRQVADSWPSVRARLKSLSELILHSYSRKNSSVVLVLNQINTKAQGGTSNHEDVGTQRIFLSKLFELIGTMCECSGDFFAERFRNDVWPTMACHLEYLLEELQRQREARLKTTAARTNQLPLLTTSSVKDTKALIPLLNPMRASFKMSDTQRQLIVSILKCLNRIIQQQECGKAIEKLLGPIGFTLLPLLDLEDQLKVQELAVDCIKSIMRINSDVLRRPLMELSGTKLPPFPLKARNNDRKNDLDLKVTKKSSVHSSTKSTTIITRCRELLDFANSLPEQGIS